MSYKALYRTYRPKNFNQVVGQDHIVITLQNIISQDKISHAYLFAGPRGTGKTSVAHVFAREVNKTAAGEIRFDDMDIIEIDAASNNGVAEVRNIIDNVNYAPSKSKYKVYIIDEVHMLTKGAFNALLKTLEEPPQHVIFIFATTEPHKIPITILSRTQRFNFRRIDDETIQKQLVEVLNKESINFDQEAIKFIAKLSQGGMRDALSIADQAAAFGNGSISFEDISQVFGIISIDNQIKIFNFAYEGKSKELMSFVNQFINNGADIERLSSSLLEILKDFIIFKKTNDHSLMTFLNVEEINKLNISTNFAYDAVDNIIKLISDIKFSMVPRQLFELSILKLVNNNEVDQIVSTPKPKVEVKNNTANFEVKKIFDDTDEISTATRETLMDSEEEISKTINAEQMEDDIENDILSTQEIEIPEVENVTKTSEIDIMKLFDSDGLEPVKAEEIKLHKFKVEDIINLMVQADRNKALSLRDKWSTIANHLDSNERKEFGRLLQSSKVILAGNGFMLLKSDDQYAIDGINIERKNPKMVELINDIFGEPILMFAINEKEFEVVKREWEILSSADKLPVAKPVEKLTIAEKDKTAEEEYGSSLFGELFSA